MTPTEGMSSSTTAGTLSGSTTESSSTTDDGSSTSLDTTGEPPLMPFCENHRGASTIACSDFDGPAAAEGFGEYELNGYVRTVNSNPPARSAPNFARLTRDDSDGSDVTEGLFGVNADPSKLEGVSLELQVRFPPDYLENCGDEPLRLGEVRYGQQNEFTSIVVEASPTSVVVSYFSPETNMVVAEFTTRRPVVNGWRRLELGLAFGTAPEGAELTVAGDLVMPSPGELIPEFDPGLADLSINVGPWFDAGEAPMPGCAYDLDNLLVQAPPP